MSQLKLIAQKSFIFEIKLPNEVFEEYDPEALTLKLVFWNPRVEYIDFVPNEQKIKVQKKMIIHDLVEQIKSNHVKNLDELKKILKTQSD